MKTLSACSENKYCMENVKFDCGKKNYYFQNFGNI